MQESSIHVKSSSKFQKTHALKVFATIVMTILVQIENKNITKALWFLIPTQLFIQGQWWSNLSTHLLHIAQCLLLADLITSHSGHRSIGLISLKSSIKSCPSQGLSFPGSLQLAYIKVMNTSKVDAIFTIYEMSTIQLSKVGKTITMLTTWTIVNIVKNKA